MSLPRPPVSLRPLLALLLMAGPMLAAPLTLPTGAIQIGQRAEDPARYALATAAYDGTRVPSQIITGALTQSAWRLEGMAGNTLSLLQPLTDQLAAQGYKVVYTCQTTECGGFDFRFGLDVLPEPQMHVDLGDFHYLAAMNAAGDAVSLLASRAADLGFVQVTSVTVAAGPAAPAVTPQLTPPPQPKPAAQPPEAGTAAPPPPPQTTDFETRLMTTGSVALDDLVFASGKATLQDQDYASLTDLAAWLAAHPDMRVTLVGHTDASGTLAGNVSLSRQRAASVRDFLVRRYNARAGQIDAQGAGYLSPRASNQTPEGRTLNRRVEVMLTSLPPR